MDKDAPPSGTTVGVEVVPNSLQSLWTESRAPASNKHLANARYVAICRCVAIPLNPLVHPSQHKRDIISGYDTLTNHALATHFCCSKGCHVWWIPLHVSLYSLFSATTMVWNVDYCNVVLYTSRHRHALLTFLTAFLAAIVHHMGAPSVASCLKSTYNLV